MDKEEIISKLKNILSGKINLNIFENQIDIKVQMEYFEYASNHRKNINQAEILEKKEILFDPNIDIEEKKEILIGLSSIDKVEAFRVLEKYSSCADVELSDWSKLALQESKMLIESSLLGENQIFISTGLGGKTGKFRYYVAFFSNTDKFTDNQRKIIKKEFTFFSSNFNAEIDELKFRNNIGICLFCLPLKYRPNDFIKTVIDECNSLGNFVDNKYLMTNVQKFSFKEINKIKNKNTIDEKN
jgi:hypothetical protein